MNKPVLRQEEPEALAIAFVFDRIQRLKRERAELVMKGIERGSDVFAREDLQIDQRIANAEATFAEMTRPFRVTNLRGDRSGVRLDPKRRGLVRVLWDDGSVTSHISAELREVVS